MNSPCLDRVRLDPRVVKCIVNIWLEAWLPRGHRSSKSLVSTRNRVWQRKSPVNRHNVSDTAVGGSRGRKSIKRE